MPLKAVIGGVEKGAVRVEVTIGNAQKRVTRIEAWNGSAWKTGQAFVLPMSVTQSSLGTIVTDKIFNLELVISQPVTAVVSGGLAPFTYAWTILSGPGVSASTGNKATTTLRITMGLGNNVFGTARCTVTDSLGTTATVDVPFNLYNV